MEPKLVETTEKLPPDIKAAWLAALRSGKYKQGSGCLKRKKGENNYEYCCLGVLLDINLERFKATWVDGHCGFIDKQFLKYYSTDPADSDPHFQSLTLPSEIKKVFGFHISRLDPGEGAISRLINMNDTGVPFTTIADWIEKHL